jgi:prenylcysteine oxidase/farnesylcysteine lyase
VTVYEREARAGGRSTTVRAWGRDDGPAVELGASIFVAVNYVLMNASAALNLTLQPASGGSPTGFKGPGLGVWDGEAFPFVQRAAPDGQGLVGWWDLVRLIWRYGVAPYRAKKLVDEVIGQFLGMYEKGLFPFEDLTEAAGWLELLEVSGMTGQQFLQSRGVDGLFAREIVQAS